MVAFCLCLFLRFRFGFNVVRFFIGNVFFWILLGGFFIHMITIRFLLLLIHSCIFFDCVFFLLLHKLLVTFLLLRILLLLLLAFLFLLAS